MLHYDNMPIEIPEWDGVRREVAEPWRMQKNAQVAVCSLWTNPEGAELRLTVDGKVQLTEVSHHLFALPIVALAWRERYHWTKEWRWHEDTDDMKASIASCWVCAHPA